MILREEKRKAVLRDAEMCQKVREPTGAPRRADICREMISSREDLEAYKPGDMIKDDKAVAGVEVTYIVMVIWRHASQS